MRAKHLATALAVLALFGGLAGSSAAVNSATAVYSPVTGDWGYLTVSANPNSGFFVYAEQPNGAYAVSASGNVGAGGSQTVMVPHVGPTSNGQPQYRVRVDFPDGTWAIVLGTPWGGGPIEEEWWID